MSEMDELLAQLKLDDLKGRECHDIAELIGMEAFIKLVRVYGGCEPYIPQIKELVKPVRNEIIEREFTGDNQFHLAKKWGLSERQVRNLTQGKLQEIKKQPISGQIGWF